MIVLHIMLWIELWHCVTMGFFPQGATLHIVVLCCRVMVHHAVVLSIALCIVLQPWHWWQHCASCCHQYHAVALATAVAASFFSLQAKNLGKIDVGIDLCSAEVASVHSWLYKKQ